MKVRISICISATKQHLQAGSHLKWNQVQFLPAALRSVGAFKLLAAGSWLFLLLVSGFLKKEPTGRGLVHQNGEIHLL